MQRQPLQLETQCLPMNTRDHLEGDERKACDRAYQRAAMVLASTQPPPTITTPRPPLRGAASLLEMEAFVTTYLDCGLGAFPWRSAGRGLQIAKLKEEGLERVSLLRAKPGTVLPRHTHTGSELTLVLRGAYFCGNTIYSAGDIEDADDRDHSSTGGDGRWRMYLFRGDRGHFEVSRSAAVSRATTDRDLIRQP